MPTAFLGLCFPLLSFVTVCVFFNKCQLQNDHHDLEHHHEILIFNEKAVNDEQQSLFLPPQTVTLRAHTLIFSFICFHLFSFVFIYFCFSIARSFCVPLLCIQHHGIKG
jgi:hypothetical protein